MANDKLCPKCGGLEAAQHDKYGHYLLCINCGRVDDPLKDPNVKLRRSNARVRSASPTTIAPTRHSHTWEVTHRWGRVDKITVEYLVEGNGPGLGYALDVKGWPREWGKQKRKISEAARRIKEDTGVQVRNLKDALDEA